MTITPHTLATESPTDELALLEVSESKGGKSWLAATAPGTLFFLDFDRRLAALRSHPNARNIYGMTFTDPADTVTMPTAISDAISVLNKLEQRPFLSNLHSSFPDKVVDTLIYDGVQTISQASMNYLLYNGGTGEDGISRNYKVGDRTIRVPKSFTAWNADLEMTTSLILQGRSLIHCKKCWHSVTSWTDPAGMYKAVHTDELISPKNPTAKKYDHLPEPRAMNIIATLHETPEEDPRSTEASPLFTGKVIVYPPRYRKLLIYFNEVWRLTRENGRIPTVTCDPDGRFVQAATALGLPAGTKFEPNIQTILQRAKTQQLTQNK